MKTLFQVFHFFIFNFNLFWLQDSSRSIANILGENTSLQVLPEPDPEESDQSILDQHVLRIWKDKTPLRSPGDPAGRPLSPGGGYRRSKQQAINSSLGPMQPHRFVLSKKDTITLNVNPNKFSQLI